MLFGFWQWRKNQTKINKSLDLDIQFKELQIKRLKNEK